MGLFKFFEGIRFNFQNVFAFSIMICCFATWWKILTGDFHDSEHITEIRVGTIAFFMIVMNYFFGASQNSKKKDETIQTMIEQTGKKDDTIKTLADAGTTTTTTRSSS